MPIVWIDADEWYPVYSVHPKLSSSGYEVQATAEQLERWTRVLAEFEAVQDEMGELYDDAVEAEAGRLQQEKAEREAAEQAERERVRRKRDREIKARQAKEAAMWQQIDASAGMVYDAQGRPIGTVGRTMSGVRLEPS